MPFIRHAHVCFGATLGLYSSDVCTRVKRATSGAHHVNSSLMCTTIAVMSSTTCSCTTRQGRQARSPTESRSNQNESS
jgi:hypothetical protein